MRYVTIDTCRQVVFPYIYDALTDQEPAPKYELEEAGLAELDKVLNFVQTDYYPSPYNKAAYLICSIAGSQYFSNGNKRLSLIILVLFLLMNETEILQLSLDGYRTLLAGHISLIWEDNQNIQGDHALFLYNLAIAIGDRPHWKVKDFSQLRERVSFIFSQMYQFPTL